MDRREIRQRFSIRKYSFGATSVLLGTTVALLLGTNTTALADDTESEVSLATSTSSSSDDKEDKKNSIEIANSENTGYKVVSRLQQVVETLETLLHSQAILEDKTESSVANYLLSRTEAEAIKNKGIAMLNKTTASE